MTHRSEQKRKEIRHFMRTIRILAALLCALLLTAPASAAGVVSAGYFYGDGAAARNYDSADIPAEVLTHINYAFAVIDQDTHKLTLPNPEQDSENLAELRQLRKSHPELKLVISAGGWDGSIYFSDIAATAQSRDAFAQSCLDLLLEQDLDGIDLDWEYPVSGGPANMVHRPEDKQNFTLLLKAIREKLDRQEARTGRDYCLTIAGGADASYLEKIEPKAVAEVTDFIFFMGYDYCGSWAPRTGFNAPLDRVRTDVQNYINAGVPAEKIVLGMPLFGRRFQVTSAANGGLDSAFEKTSSITYDALVQNHLDTPSCTLYRHAGAAAPYLFCSGEFITYDDPASIAAKSAMAKELGLAGVGFWELSQNRDGVLVQSAWDAFTGSGEKGFSDLAPDSWYTEAALQAVEAGWMSGTAPRIFAPEEPVTRGCFAAGLYAMSGETAPEGVRFHDVPADHEAAAPAAWAEETGVATGFSNGSFRPSASITREQLAAMLYRFARHLDCDLTASASLDGFADAGSVHEYARDAMAWAVGQELLQGRSGSTLAPGGTASRGEMAVILSRFAEISGLGSKS